LSPAVDGFVDGATFFDEAEAALAEEPAQADRESTAVGRSTHFGGETLVELPGHPRGREGLVLPLARDQPGGQLRQGDRTIVGKDQLGGRWGGRRPELHDLPGGRRSGP